MNVDLAELRQKALAATPGPWEFSNVGDLPGDVYQVGADEDGDLWTIDQVLDRVERVSDGEFIAAAHPSTVLALLDRLEAAARALDHAMRAKTWREDGWEVPAIDVQTALDALTENGEDHDN